MGAVSWGSRCICEFKVLGDLGGGFKANRVACRIINLQMEGSSGSPGPEQGELVFLRGRDKRVELLTINF